MERLTFVDEDGMVLFDNQAGFPEDVGFTIRELAESEDWETLDNIAQRLANCEQRLKYYKDLEEQERLLKLPCAVGDTVWDNDFGKTCSYEVTGFSFGSMNEYCVEEEMLLDQVLVHYTNSSGSITGNFAASEIGKNVFLTKEAAEAALREL